MIAVQLYTSGTNRSAQGMRWNQPTGDFLRNSGIAPRRRRDTRSPTPQTATLSPLRCSISAASTGLSWGAVQGVRDGGSWREFDSTRVMESLSRLPGPVAGIVPDAADGAQHSRRGKRATSRRSAYGLRRGSYHTSVVYARLFDVTRCEFVQTYGICREHMITLLESMNHQCRPCLQMCRRPATAGRSSWPCL